MAVAGWSCPHTGPCSSWQIKMNSVVFGSGSPFIIFHFAQRASQTSAAACHVKTLYQALTAPPLHTCTYTHTLTICMDHTHSTCAHSPTYVGNICSDLSHSHSTQHNSLHTAQLSHLLSLSHLSSGVKSVFLFFCPPLNLLQSSHMSAVALHFY